VPARLFHNSDTVSNSDRGHHAPHHQAAEHAAAAHHEGEHANPGHFSAHGPLPAVGGAGGHGHGDGNHARSASELAFGGMPAHDSGDSDQPGLHEGAMLEVDTNVEVGHKMTKLPAGTYVEVISKGVTHARVRVYSGHDGHTAVLPLDVLHQEPALVEHGKKHNHDGGAGYMEYRGVLWHETPSSKDVDQGRLNDCYVLAPAAALADADPKAIMAMFSPHEPNQPNYTVRLFKKHGHDLVPVHVTIDTFMPSHGDLDKGTGTPLYDGKTNVNNHLSTKSHTTPLWPLILEKAFAQLHQADDAGYETLDKGGVAANAMSTITGRHGTYTYGWSAHDAMSQLRSLHRKDQAVCCNTSDDPKKQALREKLNLHEWHFYYLHAIHGDKLYFRNPWGHANPDPVSAEDFVKVFNTIQTVHTPEPRHRGHHGAGGGETGEVEGSGAGAGGERETKPEEPRGGNVA
jgi:hypothetical protein